MLIRVAAIGQRMPAWVTTAWQEYAQRLRGSVRLELIELSMQRRGRNADITRLVEQEGQALMKSVPANARSVALDIKGRTWSTRELASELEGWMNDGTDVCMFIGGPDGLSSDCLASAHTRWSLGPLTLPHPLVRVILAEQLYRAWSILNRHPYHRE